MIRFCAFAVLAAAALVAPSVAAQGRPEADRFLMLDAQLNASLVQVRAIGHTSIRVADEQGGEREIPLAGVVALAPGWWRPGTDGSELASRAYVPEFNRTPPANVGMLSLVDSRRLTGRLATDAVDDAIAWDHPQLGRFTFRLDDVHSVHLLPVFSEERQPIAKASNDRVLMTNGDIVDGFVDSIGPVVRVEAAGRKVELSIRQVSSIELANALRPARGPRLWLGDGSVVGAESFGEPTGAGEVRLTMAPGSPGASAQESAAPLGDVIGVIPDASRVLPLASVPVASQTGSGDRRYAAPVALRWRGRTLDPGWREALKYGDPSPPLDAPDIEFPGPMSVDWLLPAGAARVAGWAEIPADCRLWGEFSLIFEAVGANGAVTTLSTEAMDAARPVVEFNVALPRRGETTLRARIEEGTRGPIQDRAVLRRTLLLLDSTAP